MDIAMLTCKSKLILKWKSDLILKSKSELILKCKSELILKYKSKLFVLKYKNAVVYEWVNSGKPSEARGVPFATWMSERSERMNEQMGPSRYLLIHILLSIRRLLYNYYYNVLKLTFCRIEISLIRLHRSSSCIKLFCFQMRHLQMRQFSN